MANIINLNGIDYIEIPAKTNDKICKDCEYFLNNGKCTLDECPCKKDEVYKVYNPTWQYRVDDKFYQDYINTVNLFDGD